MLTLPEKQRAKRNRTITLSQTEHDLYSSRLVKLTTPAALSDLLDRTIHQDLFKALQLLPEKAVDLLFIDPPYNLTKQFHGNTFSEMSTDGYTLWFASWFVPLLRVLKPTASVYICGDWRSSPSIFQVASRHLHVRNRITWEREKGRGALNNWKNAAEDIWFCTVSNSYTFNVEDVKIKRKVIAPYRHSSGQPRDWEESAEGNFRVTYPSNLWTDLTVPFWSMPENTDHPTQKPEKLLAKVILASSRPEDVVMDPFVGSGTTSVVAKKLGRHYIGIEQELDYCCLTEKRLDLANQDPSIQGYSDGVFWERNTGREQRLGDK